MTVLNNNLQTLIGSIQGREVISGLSRTVRMFNFSGLFLGYLKSVRPSPKGTTTSSNYSYTCRYNLRQMAVHTFQTYDDGQFELDALTSVDDATCNGRAVHDAAKHVHQDHLNLTHKPITLTAQNPVVKMQQLTAVLSSGLHVTRKIHICTCAKREETCILVPKYFT